MFFGSSDGIAILVHGEAETDILPEGTHITFADAVVDELGDLVQGCPGYTMLSNVHFPRLNGLPDFLGEVKLNSFLVGTEIGAVDGAVIDCQ